MATDEQGQQQAHWVVPAELRLQLLAALALDPQQTQAITHGEFLEWADEDTLAEWVDGKVVMASPASLKHQLLVGFLLRVLSDYVESRDLGVVLAAPFQMKLSRSGREPDLLFVASAHRGRLHETYLDGPADVAVEVVLPESAARDRGEKFYEYEAAGVPEYWLLDPDAERAEFYQLDEHGTYRQIAPDANGIYQSHTLPGFWLETGWLWSDPLPRVTEALRTNAGESQAPGQTQQPKGEGATPAEDHSSNTA